MAERVRVGVADDSEASREVLVAHLRRYERENRVEFSVRTFTDGSELVRDYRSDFDIVFLDVQMEQMDGFETARAIRARDQEVVLVFVTNLGQYAIRGYEVNALSYLIKPVSYFAFARELRRGVALAQRPGASALLLRTAEGVVRVDPADVLYIESNRHRMMVHTLGERYSLTGTLKKFEAELADQGFFRCNSGYLVNMRHVVAVDQSACRLTGGVELVVSRARRRAFLDALTGTKSEGAT